MIATVSEAQRGIEKILSRGRSNGKKYYEKLLDVSVKIILKHLCRTLLISLAMKSGGVLILVINLGTFSYLV